DEGVEEKKDKDAEKKDADKKDDEKKEGDKDKKEGEKKEGDADKKKEKEEVKVVVDLDGLDQRVLALPLPAGRYTSLECTKDKLFFLSRTPDDADDEDESGMGPAANLKSFDFDSKKPKEIAKGVQGFKISGDGKSLLLRTRDGWSLSDLEAKEKKPLK